MSLPVEPPLEPMLSKAAEGIPEGDGWLFEPKWDGFRALVFKEGGEIRIQSRESRPLERYFPELLGPLAGLPERVVLDGEIVIAAAHGLDFDALQQRLHPAKSRVNKLAAETPASYVAFDLLALGDADLRALPQGERRALLEETLAGVRPPLHLTPVTRDRALAQEWFERFEGAGFDGVMAKRTGGAYEAGKRTMFKVKHARTADCVVAGFRWHKSGGIVGSLLLGLYSDGELQHVGVTSSFTMARRKQLVEELAPLRDNAVRGHPWAGWLEQAHDAAPQTRMPGGQSRWTGDKDLSWEPLRVERVCEVKYDHLQGNRFRHAATFLRWRDDKRPSECRYDQLEVVTPYELKRIFGL